MRTFSATRVTVSDPVSNMILFYFQPTFPVFVHALRGKKCLRNVTVRETIGAE